MILGRSVKEIGLSAYAVQGEDGFTQPQPPATGFTEEQAEVFNAVLDVDLREAIEDLPEPFRLAVVLSDVEGFSYKEIADMLDVPLGTVMSRLFRGRRILRKRLTDAARSTAA